MTYRADISHSSAGEKFKIKMLNNRADFFWGRSPCLVDAWPPHPTTHLPMAFLLCVSGSYFPLFFGCTHGMKKFLGQGMNLCCHSTDNTRSSTVRPEGKSLIYPFFFFGLFRATSTAHGGSQARGQIQAIAASLHHSHSMVQDCLWPTPELRATLDP